jgi:hypothetical protein
MHCPLSTPTPMHYIYRLSRSNTPRLIDSLTLHNRDGIELSPSCKMKSSPARPNERGLNPLGIIR